MKAVLLGRDRRASEFVTMACRLSWPDTEPFNAPTTAVGVGLVEHESPDVAIFLPDYAEIDLLEGIKEVRRLSRVPLLALRYIGEEMEMVNVLEAGADDYVSLPCTPTELMARILALLRRWRTGTDHALKSNS